MHRKILGGFAREGLEADGWDFILNTIEYGVSLVAYANFEE